jgi:hypothetical protein
MSNMGETSGRYENGFIMQHCYDSDELKSFRMFYFNRRKTEIARSLNIMIAGI